MAEFDLGLTEIIAIIAVPSIGIMVTTLLNMKAQKSVSRGQFATLLNSLSQDHSKLLEQEHKLDSIESCFNYALSYIDLLNRIAYLCNHEKMSTDIGNYFRKYFEYVQLMMNWYDDTVFWDQKTPAQERWDEIMLWCHNGHIPADQDRGDLPEALKIIWSQYDTLNLKKRYPEYFDIKKIKMKKRTDKQNTDFEYF